MWAWVNEADMAITRNIFARYICIVTL